MFYSICDGEITTLLKRNWTHTEGMTISSLKNLVNHCVSKIGHKTFIVADKWHKLVP